MELSLGESIAIAFRERFAFIVAAIKPRPDKQTDLPDCLFVGSAAEEVNQNP